MPHKIVVCASDALPFGVVKTVAISPDEHGHPREAIVLRDQDSALRAYVNRCMHIDIPLDGGSRDFLTKDKKHLACGTHGAWYRLHDGFCIAGPCLGESLEPCDVAVEEGNVFITDPSNSSK